MFGYIVRRLISGVLVLIAVSMIVFAIFFYGPNDPALAYCPESRCTQPGSTTSVTTWVSTGPPPAVRRVHERARQEQPHRVRCDLSTAAGRAWESRSSTASRCSTISGHASLRPSRWHRRRHFFLTLGLSSGIFAARRRGTPADKAVVSASLFINAIPYYLLALLAYLYLVQGLGLFPETGYHSPFTEGPAKWVPGWRCPGSCSGSSTPRSTPGSAVAP